MYLIVKYSDGEFNNQVKILGYLQPPIMSFEECDFLQKAIDIVDKDVEQYNQEDQDTQGEHYHNVIIKDLEYERYIGNNTWVGVIDLTG